MDEEVVKFLKSYDFMRLGQAINRGQWQSAAMIQRRMEQKVKQLELTTFERPLAGLRQAILRKNVLDAKQMLAGVVAKRARMLNSLN